VGAVVPLSVGELDPHVNPSNRLASVHQRHRQTGQRSDSIGRTVLQTVARKLMELGLNRATLCVMVDEDTLSVTSGV